MSDDAFLWIATLLFAATMLILAAMRRPEGEGAGDLSLDAVSDSWDLGPPSDRGIDLGGGWTLGGGDDDRS